MRSGHQRGLRVLSAVLAVVLLLTVSLTNANAADDDRRGISGTVMHVESTSVRVAIKSGLRTVFIDSNTIIRRSGEPISIGDIIPGDRISAQVEALLNSDLLANLILVRGNSKGKEIDHLTGVVVQADEDGFQLADRRGRVVDIEVDDDDAVPEVADVVTTVVETDLATGDIRAYQIEQVEKIVHRLEQSLSEEFDEARAEVLRTIIDESSRQHLNTLNQTLDQVEAEAREKITAALDKFRQDYGELAERIGNPRPMEAYEGVIARVFVAALVVNAPNGGGSREFRITGETEILISGEAASTVDLLAGQSVRVSFLDPADAGNTSPPAALVEVLPPALPPAVADIVEELNDGVVEGEITVVESDETNGDEVIIIEEDRTGDTVGVQITEETEITVDGESATPDQLAPDQAVEVTLSEDGVTAESVVASTSEPSASEQSISGVITAIDADRRVVVIAPAQGDPVRLQVITDAVITLDGASVALKELQSMDIALQTSRYLPESSTITRLSASRPAAGEESTPSAGSSMDEGGSVASGTGSGSTSSTFSITGFLKSFNTDFVVFDDVTLPAGTGLALPEGVTEGSEVKLIFSMGQDGSIVLSGIAAP